MSDSVDRVFSHALNTVNKIRTGAEKPPVSVRLKLYGMYKQSMEGDVDGIMDRPEGRGEEAHRQREKWNAWKAQSGLSRTEAKRRYISTLLEAMNRYAAQSPDARELVTELEFVWDQVKSNVPSSSSSSPVHTLGLQTSLHNPPSYHSFGSPQASRRYDHNPERPSRNIGPLRILSPQSQSNADEDDLPNDEEDKDGAEEFVDAPDSQYNPETQGDSGETNTNDDNLDHSPPPRHQDRKPTLTRKMSTSSERHWRRRVEQALVKMTAEVAALREQLESRRLFSHRRRMTVFALAWRGCWFVVKHMMVNFVVLLIIMLWMRRKKDRRLEGAVRVLLGDAVAQVQKVGQGGMAKIGAALPTRPPKKGA